MPRLISLEDLEKTKQHNHHWTWPPGKLPEKKSGPSRTYFKLKCGLCGIEKWVIYNFLKRGQTMCCRKCSRKPTIARMKSIIEKYDMLWIPTTITKSVGRRRSFFFKCGGCSKNFWVRWSLFSQGNSGGCKSCMKRKQLDRSHKDRFYYYKHPMMRQWRNMRGGGKKGISNWNQDFYVFKEWAMKNGFVEKTKPVLKRKNSKLPHSPENSYWVATAEIGRNTVKETR